MFEHVQPWIIRKTLKNMLTSHAAVCILPMNLHIVSLKSVLLFTVRTPKNLNLTMLRLSSKSGKNGGRSPS